MHTSISLLAALAATAAAKNIVITVGADGLVFSPDSPTADIGDVLEFQFVSSIHTVVQGDFSTPCAQGSLSSTGFDSGPVTSSDVFQVTVQSTDPIWFYCSTPGHCQSGMAGVINPPSSGDTLAAYKSAAAKTTTSTSANKVQGGQVVPAGSLSSSASASSSPSPSTSTPSASAKSSTSAPSTTQKSSPASSSATASGSGSSQSGASTTSSAAGSAASSPSGSAASSPSGSASPSLTSKPNQANSVLEVSGKVVMLGLVVGLGAFVVLMA